MICTLESQTTYNSDGRQLDRQQLLILSTFFKGGTLSTIFNTMIVKTIIKTGSCRSGTKCQFLDCVSCRASRRTWHLLMLFLPLQYRCTNPTSPLSPSQALPPRLHLLMLEPGYTSSENKIKNIQTCESSKSLSSIYSFLESC